MGRGCKSILRGPYKITGDKLTATVTTNRHTHYSGIPSIFGIDKVTIRLDGTVRGDTADCVGKADQAPGVAFHANLTRISD